MVWLGSSSHGVPTKSLLQLPLSIGLGSGRTVIRRLALVVGADLYAVGRATTGDFFSSFHFSPLIHRVTSQSDTFVNLVLLSNSSLL